MEGSMATARGVGSQILNDDEGPLRQFEDKNVNNHLHLLQYYILVIVDGMMDICTLCLLKEGLR
jgi:hypothetical protein